MGRIKRKLHIKENEGEFLENVVKRKKEIFEKAQSKKMKVIYTIILKSKKQEHHALPQQEML